MFLWWWAWWTCGSYSACASQSEEEVLLLELQEVWRWGIQRSIHLYLCLSSFHSSTIYVLFISLHLFVIFHTLCQSKIDKPFWWNKGSWCSSTHERRQNMMDYSGMPVCNRSAKCLTSCTCHFFGRSLHGSLTHIESAVGYFLCMKSFSKLPCLEHSFARLV